MKVLKNHRSANTGYFWRTHQQQEIDYVEEQGNNLLAAEIKWRTGRGKIPATFTNAYPSAKGIVVSRENWRALAYAATD